MRYLFIFLYLGFSPIMSAQEWNEVSLKDMSVTGIQDITPLKYTLYRVDDEQIKQILWSAPDEISGVKNSKTELQVGLPDGKTETFRIVRYAMMEEGLQVQYPDIRTFHGISTTTKACRIRIDYTEQGFRAVISGPEQDKIYIDHFQRGDKNSRIVYYKKDYKKVPSWGCLVDDEFLKEHKNDQSSGLRIGDCQFRSYRLAQATTGEYSRYFGAFNPGQSGLVLSAVTTGINRINEVYESEIAVRLILVANNTQIFYYDPTTDPYTATNASTMLGENQTTCTNVIGSANYDIGHVFGALGNNGVASLGSVCSANNKARGVTTSTAPVNDPFYIDYVAHEMGHQFGGNHTQNNNCNRVAAAAREPGSASTIMGYAGICSPNVQSNSDAYFHAYSLQEMKNFLLGNGGNCDNFVPGFNNSPPLVTSQPNYVIPRSTPFSLTLQATDPDDDVLVYAWEQMDNQVATMPPVSTNTGGPTFRSILYTLSPTRLFPNRSTILAGNTANTWEVVPSVGRTMSFRGVVRDISENSTASCNSEINLTVTTVAAAGPFVITSQNTPTTWVEGQLATITWNVAGTTGNGINCSNVEILFSSDGGQTFPVVLESNAPNSGSFEIIVPAVTTTLGRIMVKGVGNIFFDINNANITVSPGAATFTLAANPISQTICQGQSKTFDVSVGGVLGFSNPVTLSLPGLPAGYAANFSINPVLPNNTSVLTITNVSAPAGSTNQNINGVSGSINKNTNVTIISNNSVLSGVPGLTFPSDNAVNIGLKPVFTWTSVSGANAYELQLTRIEDFSEVVLENLNVPGTSFGFNQFLEGGSEYFWRVRAKNDCITGVWSGVSSFSTESCYFYGAQDLPIAIPPTGTPTINSIRLITDKGTVSDLDVMNLTGTHTFISDLRFTLFSPNTTNVVIWNQPCGGEDDFNINFDQQAPVSPWPCPPVNGGTYRPSNSLNGFNNQSVNGQWSLQVQDLADQDGGSLNSWGIKTCLNDFCRLVVDNPFPKGAGSLYDAIQCALPGDTIRFAAQLDNDTIQLGNQNLIMSKDIVIEADLSRNIHIMSDINNTLMSVQNTTSGEGLRIKGLHIHAVNSAIGGIDNRGKLILDDVILYNFPMSSFTTINNRTGAVLEIKGNCSVVND